MICSLGRFWVVFWWTFPQFPIHLFIHLFIYVTFFCMCIYIYMNVYTYQVLYASAIINKLFFLCWSSSESEVRYHPAPCFSWLLVAFPSFVLSVQPLFWMFYRKILLHLFLFVMKYIWVHGQSTGPNKVGIFHGLPSAYLTAMEKQHVYLAYKSS